MLNKSNIIAHITSELEERYNNAVNATQQAHETATHEENVAENKYDTLGLEAGYLAFGQSQRVAECASDLQIWRNVKQVALSKNNIISVGALVELLDEQDKTLTVFLGPAAGGLKIETDKGELIVVTPSAPLGQALVGRCWQDELEIQLGDKTKLYIIEDIS